MASSSLQLFVWVGQGQVKETRVHYQSFTLNDVTYHVGECVYLYPEDEQYPPYIARILSAFVDKDVQPGADPHCIEVKWFERRVNLEPSTKGIEESEREVFELEDTDVNPIGCISGKCRIVKANNYEEAFGKCGTEDGWFFCRGYFHQSSNSFVGYSPAEMAMREGAEALDALLGPAGADLSAGLRGAAEPLGRGALGGGDYYSNGGGEEDEESDEPPPSHRGGRHAQPPPAAQQPASKRQKATGRTCVECGATSTPQWREGPAGPKTLCNACGVRYVRSMKAAGQKRSSGGQKNGQGRPQESTPPRAQQGNRVSRRVTNPKVSQSELQTSAS
ncbi:hypothetical protein HYH03_018846 [Edaphochlamys debaryana]|uniref:GATA-type domain-containing protein n=1 Tax=Edaphochlamys debaryana TaxID=47281 RepID=A0A836BMQ5_9CHLO|nr:hypothetical protein HYH03_018846 [Edaphochlamys debaryana]|eukprot:KAG2482200.1 hypothetical protein HYH03_018846 [Edaphochlamys debaryana]